MGKLWDLYKPLDLWLTGNYSKHVEIKWVILILASMSAFLQLVFSDGKILLCEIYDVYNCPDLKDRKVTFVISLNICNMCPSRKSKHPVIQAQKQMRDNEHGEWVFLFLLQACWSYSREPYPTCKLERESLPQGFGRNSHITLAR